MTVRATYLAFGDLRENYRPRLSYNEDCDFLTFGRTIPMVELERDDIGLVAVHTRMQTQIVLEKTAILVSAPADTVDLAGDVLGTIAEVVISAISGMARPAVVLPFSERLVLKSERRSGLQKSAPDASAKKLARLLDIDRSDRHKGPLRSGSALRSA